MHVNAQRMPLGDPDIGHVPSQRTGLDLHSWLRAEVFGLAPN